MNTAFSCRDGPCFLGQTSPLKSSWHTSLSDRSNHTTTTKTGSTDGTALLRMMLDPVVLLLDEEEEEERYHSSLMDWMEEHRVVLRSPVCVVTLLSHTTRPARPRQKKDRGGRSITHHPHHEVPFLRPRCFSGCRLYRRSAVSCGHPLGRRVRADGRRRKDQPQGTRQKQVK